MACGGGFQTFEIGTEQPYGPNSIVKYGIKVIFEYGYFKEEEKENNKDKEINTIKYIPTNFFII